MRHTWIGALLALALVFSAPALGNGDPASDVLLQAKVYFPTQQVGADSANALKALTDRASARGYPIRVALIHDETDLGTVPDLLNQPQKYAEFLGPEIRFAYKGDLLVVMPNGLGLTTTDDSPPPMKAIDGVKVEAGGSPDGLARTAELVIPKLAAAAGKPLASEGGAGGGALAGIIVAVALLIAGAVGALWVRRSQAQQPAPPA